jgi:tetratricopeptide (TPR) repeat protein
MRFACGALVLAAVFGSPAYAATDADYKSCEQQKDLDRRIAACTRIVQDRGESNSNRAISYLNRGDAYYFRRDYDRAIADYTEAIRIDPKNSASFNSRANAYSGKGDRDRAIADYDEAIRLNPKNADAYSNRCDEWSLKGNNDRAIADCSEAIKLAPKSANAYITRAIAYFDQRDSQRAIADANRAIELRPKAWQAIRIRALAHAQKREYERAVADLDAALPLAPGGIKANILLNRLDALVRLKRFAPAAIDLITLARDHPKEVNFIEYREIYPTIDYLREQQRDADALSILLWLKKAEYRGSEAVSIGDGLNPALIGQYVRLKRVEEAAPYIAELHRYTNLLELIVDRTNEALWTNAKLQPVLQLRDFSARQLAAAQKLALQHPKALPAVYNLVDALRLNGRYAEAAKLGQDALGNLAAYDRNPEYEAWLRNAVANALIAQGRFDEANGMLQPLLQGDPKQSAFLVNQFINYGTQLLDQGRFEEAMATAQKARGHSSPYGEKFVQMVSVCAMARTGQSAEAQALMADMLKAPDENYGATLDALICLKREEETAALLIKMLQSERHRQSVLEGVQDCRENPNRPAVAREQWAAFLKIRDRSDVRKAIEQAGRVLVEPIACGDRYRSFG